MIDKGMNDPPKPEDLMYHGGLMRCCIDTWIRKGPVKAKKGDLLACDYCQKGEKPTMRFTGEAWEWNR